jgi:hypothetical protein
MPDEDDILTELMKKGAPYSTSKNYVAFDEIEDVLTSSDLLALVAPFVARKRKASYWKWVIIAAHNALQGAMVCSYADSTGISVLDEKTCGPMLKWLEAPPETRGKYPQARMADFGVLLKRCMTEDKRFKPALILTARQLMDIRRLHADFRNNFAHFQPKRWSIEKEGLPRIVGAAMDATEWLMSHDNVTYRMSGNKLRRLRANLKAAKAALGIKKAR